MARVNMCLGAKGGIGKSFVAAIMAQYLGDNKVKKPPVCIDLDFKTKTFAKYRGLDVKLIDAVVNGEIDKQKLDPFIYHITDADPDDVFVIDTGGNIYLSLMNYLLVNGVADMLLEMGHELLLHVPVMGGQELGETMETLAEVLAEMPRAAMVAVWLNQLNGIIEQNGKNFSQFDTYLQNRDRIRTITHIPEWRSDMRRDVSEMLKARVTFDEAMKMPSFALMNKQRLKMAKAYLYQAVQESGVCE